MTQIRGYLHFHPTWAAQGELCKKPLTDADKKYGWTETPLYDRDAPIPMVLHCPSCGARHIDEPTAEWDNPPHRSHLCGACGCIWRPADVPTVGVAAITTKGEADNWPPPTVLIVKPPGGGTGTGRPADESPMEGC